MGYRRKLTIWIFGFISVIFVVLCVLFIELGHIPVTFSKDSGFFEEPFYLYIKHDEDTKIYYTTDGSEPDEHSAPYIGSIYIDNATKYENTISMITDVSTAFRLDLIMQYQALDGDVKYRAPDYLIDKCNVLRFVAINSEGERKYYYKTYIVGKNAANDDYKYISIIMDPDDLFDREKGIYVTGDIFEKYIAGNVIKPLWRQWGANYSQHGTDWERNAYIEVFNAVGKLELGKNVGIRVRGGVSRALLPKGFNLYARNSYDGKNRFNADLFNNGYNPKRISLCSGGNQPEIQLYDKMIADRVRELNFSSMNFIPCICYLNGEYWGFYYISEKYDEVYIENYFGVDKDNVIMIKNGAIEAGNEDDIAAYLDMRSFISENDMSISENYRYAGDMIDISSFIDYYASLIYISRCEDWPHGNFALWRSKDINTDNPYADNKWRYMLFDCNSSSMAFAQGNVDHNTLQWVMEMDPVFSSLWANDEFKESFKDRLFYIGDTCFEPSEMEEYIWDYCAGKEPLLEDSWKRYYGLTNSKREEFYKTIEATIDFFYNRRNVIESWDELK